MSLKCKTFFFSSIKISSHDGESGEGKSVKWKSYFRYTSWCAFDMKWNWKFFNVKNFQEILKVLWGKHLCVNCRTSMSRHFPIFIHYCKSFFLPHLIMKDRSPDKHKNYFSFFFLGRENIASQCCCYSFISHDAHRAFTFFSRTAL